MTEVLISNWAALVAWTCAALFVTQFAAVSAALWLDGRRRSTADGVRYRCGALVGELGPNATGHEGYTWCALPEDHGSVCRDEYGAVALDYAMAQHGATEDTVTLGLARLRHDLNATQD